MRYVLAIVALAISGVLLLLGIGQRTFLAGPSEIVYSIGATGDAPYAVIDVEELTKVAGQANVVMRGEGTFAALANTRDAEAWLEPFDHVELTVDAKARVIEATTVRGEAPTNDLLATDDDGNVVPIDPRGSDLWLAEREGNEAGTRMAVEPAADQSVIIAGTDAEPLPKGTALVWVQDRATPLAGPLLAAGGLFAALGAVLYLLAFDRDKRALGPRRGRRGPLVGVQNVFGGSKRRGKQAAADAPKRGSLENTPDGIAGGAAAGVLAEGQSASTAGAESASTAGAEIDAEAVVAEVVVDAEPVDGEVASADTGTIDAIVVEEVDDVDDVAPVEEVEAVEEGAGDGHTADDVADGPVDGAATEPDEDTGNKGDGNAK